MLSSHLPPARLTPVSHPCKVLITQLMRKNGDQTVALITRETRSHFNFERAQREIDTNHDLFILDNGFYFTEFYEFEPIEDTSFDISVQSTKPTIRLCRAFNTDNYVDITVDSFISPHYAATLSETKDDYVICGVDRNLNEIFAYSISGNIHLKELRGTSVYKSESPAKTIIGIASCLDLTTKNLVIAFSTGEIIVGEIHFGNFHKKFTLMPECAELAKPTLFATREGMVIAHYPESNKLCTFDLTNPEHHQTITTQKSLYRLTLSPEGRYLTGLEFKDGVESDTVICFDLKTMQHHTILLEKPVADCVIGYQQEVIAILHQRQADKDKNIPLLHHLGPITNVLKQGSKPVLLDPVPTQPKNPGNWSKLMSKFGQHAAKLSAQAKNDRQTPEQKM